MRCTMSFLLIVLLKVNAFAQTKSKLDFIVLNSGDTLYGEVKYINENAFNRRFYKKLRLTTTDGKQKKLKRKNVSAFRAKGINYKRFSLNQSSQNIRLINPIYDITVNGREHYFLRVISKGKLAHYELEWFEQGESALWSMALLKKEGDSFFIRADQGAFGLKRKTLITYFSNCKSLQDAINQKQLRKVSEIIEFYNSRCTDRH